MRRNLIILVVLSLAVCPLIACNSIHLQTGPPTTEERTDQSDQRGQGMRADFSRRLEGLQPIAQAQMVIQFIDTATSQYFRYGDRIAEQWATLSDQQGRELPDSEMREVIERSISTDLPVMESYDDIVDYGIAQLHASRYFDDPTAEIFNAYRDYYFRLFSYIFYPNGSRSQYFEGLYDLRSERTILREAIAEELRRY